MVVVSDVMNHIAVQVHVATLVNVKDMVAVSDVMNQIVQQVPKAILINV
jgi:translation elongation factor EF-4